MSERVDSSGVIWKHGYNPVFNKNEMIQVQPVDNDTLTGKTIEKIINRAWPRVLIQFVKTSNDTAFIRIPESKILTQQMGTAGATTFMMSVTWSFTELKGIRHVAFDFEYGDHAMPGVYDRLSWEERRE